MLKSYLVLFSEKERLIKIADRMTMPESEILQQIFGLVI